MQKCVHICQRTHIKWARGWFAAQSQTLPRSVWCSLFLSWWYPIRLISERHLNSADSVSNTLRCAIKHFQQLLQSVGVHWSVTMTTTDVLSIYKNVNSTCVRSSECGRRIFFFKSIISYKIDNGSQITFIEYHRRQFSSPNSVCVCASYSQDGLPE